jgi:AraC-like DNA-binding protein
MTTVPVVETVAFKTESFESAEAKLRRFWRGTVVVPREFGPIGYELTALCSRRLAVGKVSCRVARTSRASVTQPMLQVPLDSSTEFRVGRTRIAIEPGEAILLAPGHEYTAHDGAGSALFLQIDMAALVGGLPPGRNGGSRHWAVRCMPVDVAHACGIDVHTEVDSLLRKSALLSSDDRSAGFADLERRVVSCLPGSLLDRGGLWNFVPAGSLLAEDAGEWIESNLSGPITLESLAEKFGVTGRWLQKCFTARWGITPMDYVINRRLALARSCLMSPDGSSVTGTAIRCGFNHLGRFAGLYRGTYGESPSDTVARAAIRRQRSTVAKLTEGRALVSSIHHSTSEA